MKHAARTLAVLETLFLYSGIPPLFKVHFRPLRFYEDLHYYLFFLTERNPKKILVFMNKGKKRK